MNTTSLTQAIPPASFAGVDGCPDGWLVASKSSGSDAVSIRVYRTFADIVAAPFTVIAIDIPIGLPDAGARACDQLARKAIGPRRSSVFPCPIRPVLSARDYSEACGIGLKADGRKMSKQAWAIAPKIAEVDGFMTPTSQARIIEVHPEVCFFGLNQESPLAHPKKTEDGLGLRRRLLMNVGLDPSGFYEGLPSGAARDDLHDALAALWTAIRFHKGEATCLPASSETDSRDLRMEMWY